MKHLLTCAALLGGLLGCAAEPSKLQHERSYVLEWIGERPLIDNSHLTLTLADDGRAYGTAGCNHWFASYTQNGERLSFGQVGKTRKLCAPALMEQEERYLKALQSVQRWDVSSIEQIRLWPAEGKPLRFWADED